MVWVAHSLRAESVRPPVTRPGWPPVARSRKPSGQGSARSYATRRDAMTLSWTGGRGVCELTVPQWLADLSRGPHGRLRARWLLFDAEAGVRVHRVPGVRRRPASTAPRPPSRTVPRRTTAHSYPCTAPGSTPTTGPLARSSAAPPSEALPRRGSSNPRSSHAHRLTSTVTQASVDQRRKVGPENTRATSH